MFDIGWSELVVIGVVALIAIGPKELPGVLRACGQWMGKIRRMANEFQDQFREAMREAEVADIKKQVDEMTQTASSYANFDPMESVRRDVDDLMKDTPATATSAATPEVAAEAATQPAAPEVATPSEPVPPAGVAASAEAAAPHSPPKKAGEGA